MVVNVVNIKAAQNWTKTADYAESCLVAFELRSPGVQMGQSDGITLYKKIRNRVGTKLGNCCSTVEIYIKGGDIKAYVVTFDSLTITIGGVQKVNIRNPRIEVKPKIFTNIMNGSEDYFSFVNDKVLPVSVEFGRLQITIKN